MINGYYFQTELLMTNKEASLNNDKLYSKVIELTYSRPIICDDEFQFFRCKGKHRILYNTLIVLADKTKYDIKEIYEKLQQVRYKNPWNIEGKINNLIILVTRQVI